ncbi:glycosyltransferase [Streptomyces sp. CA-210063]|uniref:glycosyltransferase n=1 Tax=Streptomyces sp. CA-210063 TaxID=2801029 RepID=UPI00214C7E13|nr:glycosyltransferase [Streptomyces sp. CA-210063]UUU30246.1 glycosyltransferase [Streptomyces sp. CA-210063]
MRALFVCEAGEGTVFPLVPLTQALRSGGHEVLVAGHTAALPIVSDAGLPGVAVAWREPRSFATDDDGNLIPLPTELDERKRQLGRLGARMAADALTGLRGLTRRWRPDVVISSPQSYAAPLLAAELSVPHVQVGLDMSESPLADAAAEEELLPDLAELGLRAMPAPQLALTLCPHSIRYPGARPALAMRHVPYNTARTVEDWAYARGDRPRVLVTAGSRVSPSYSLDFLRSLVAGAACLDAELLVAVPESVVPHLGPLPPGVRAGWIPLDVVAPTCDLAIHQAGGATLTCVVHAVPQLVVPFMPDLVGYAQRLAGTGAARMIPLAEATVDAVASTAEEMLGDPGHQKAAQVLRAEALTAPSPVDLVGRIERLAATHAARPGTPAT